jgi:hypothetical protein
MDLNSYIQLKEAYTQVRKPQQLTEGVDSIWEEVEAFAHALVEEEGLDLSDMTWDEVYEAYLEEQGGSNAMRLRLQKNNAAVKAAQPAAAPKTFSDRRNARRSASPAAQANTNSVGQNIKTTPSTQKPQPTAAKPQPTAAKPQPTAAKPQPTAAKPSPSPMMSDLKKRMPKPAAPKPSGSSLTGNRASSFMSKSGGAAAASKAPKPSASPIKSNRLRAALDSVKNEEFSDFDIILTHLIEQGFGDDEALTLMVNMTEEKREEILQLDEISKKLASSYIDKAADDRDKNAKDGSGEAFNKAERREKNIQRASSKLYKGTPAGEIMGVRNPAKVGATGEKKKTRKEETDSLYQAYLSMMSEEESDKRKDKHLESGGHSAKTDYSKPPSTGNTFGKKKPMSDEDRSAAMAKIVAKLKKQGGK